MTWMDVGWIVMGVAALLLAALGWLRKAPSYPLRSFPFSYRVQQFQTHAIERGQRQTMALGNRFWSQTYPGLGLSSLLSLRNLLTPETLAAGEVTVSAASGALVTLANQIVQGAYQDGFSDQLLGSKAQVTLHGPSPSSFTAGLLAALKPESAGLLLMVGDYGAEALLPAMAISRQGGEVLAAAGTLQAQAVLYPLTRDLLLGEEVYRLSARMPLSTQPQVGLMVEDMLRVGLILGLILGAMLTMIGVL